MAGERPLKVRLRRARGRRAGSTRWLQRQVNDPYVQSAREQGWRSRAAYKLQQIDARFRLLRPGLKVLDLGAAPGGWSQYALRRSCRVVAVDLLPMPPLEGVEVIEGDALSPPILARALDILGGRADVLLSDIAASATGQRAVDRLRAEAIGEAVLDLAGEALAPGGAAVIKLVRGAENPLLERARPLFTRTRLVRPDATRKESSEIYLVALGFRPEPPVGGEGAG